MSTTQAARRPVPREAIERMADLIAQRFRPDRIILFGSYARGQARADSDVDLMVLVAKAPPEGKRSAPILRLLCEQFDYPVDVVVRTSRGFEEWRHVIGSLARQVDNEGVVLYERPA